MLKPHERLRRVASDLSHVLPDCHPAHQRSVLAVAIDECEALAADLEVQAARDALAKDTPPALPVTLHDGRTTQDGEYPADRGHDGALA